MDDIRRQDLRLFMRECLDVGRLISTLAIGLLVAVVLSNKDSSTLAGFLGFALVTFVSLCMAWNASTRKRFSNPRLRALWAGCQDRLARFEEVLKRMRREQVADFREMPETIRRVGDSLYAALRRADMITAEVETTERDMLHQPPTWHAGSNDAQSRELYRLADKNIAEYRAQFAGVMAGVQRTEAQSAVYMTTLDSLRMKMIGYRLVGRSPELGSGEFLTALAEARTQLQAIDHALEELDLGHYPKTISVVPPPMPEDVEQRLGQG